MNVTEQDLDAPRDLPIRDPRLKGLLDYWHSLRGDMALPRYRDVDPIAIPKLLSHVWCWSYDAEKSDFIGRLAGESVLEVFGSREMRGLSLNDFAEPELAAILRERYLRVVQEPAIAHFIGVVRLQNDISIPVERLALPMCDRTAESRVIMGLSLYEWPGGARSSPGFGGEEGSISWAPTGRGR